MKRIFGTMLLISFLSIGGCKENKQNNNTTNIKNKDTEIIAQGEYLENWNDGTNKQIIVNYIDEITDPDNKNFIPEEDRIAVFDNDGTLATERPAIFLLYAIERLADSQYSNEKILEAKDILLNGDGNINKLKFRGLMKTAIQYQSDMSTEAYQTDVKNYFATKNYPKFNIKMTEVAYKPQVELIKYLQDNKFKVYIVSGSEVDFLRAISKELYNIDSENVIGLTMQYDYDYDTNIITREQKIDYKSDKKQKPINIAKHIGKIPVIAVGNIGNAGDIDMLRYSESSKYKNLQLLVNHDDSDREEAYGEKDNKSMEAAKYNGWKIISIKDDWKTIFNKK